MRRASVVNGPVGGAGVVQPGVAAVLCALSAAAPAQTCAPVPGISLQGDPRGIVVRDGLAFVANTRPQPGFEGGEGGLYIYDLAEADRPRLVGAWVEQGPATLALFDAIDVDAERAYLREPTGLSVIDVSDPAHPQLLAEVPGPELTHFRVKNGIGYYADGESLTLVDLSDPESPAVLGRTEGGAIAVDVQGGFAYHTDDRARLYVTDVSNPRYPVSVGELPALPATADVVMISGNLAFLGGAKLMIVEVSDPASPRLIAQLTPADTIRGLALEGERLCAAVEDQGIQVFDVSDPTAPLPLGQAGTPDRALDAAYADGFVLLAEESRGLSVVDVSDPASPGFVRTIDMPLIARAIGVDGSLCAVGSGDGANDVGFPSLLLLDVGNPALPVPLASLEVGDDVRGVALRDGIAYMAASAAGFQIADVSDPYSPELLATLPTPGLARAVALLGDLAYVADETGGLRIIDVSDPALPEEIGSFDVPESAHDIVISGSVAFVAAEEAGVMTLDLSDPTDPAPLDQVRTPSDAKGIHLAGGLAYVALKTGIAVIDASDPSKLTLLDDLPLPVTAFSTVISDDIAYLAANQAGVVFVNVFDPGGLDAMGGFNTKGQAFDVAVRGGGDFLFVSDAGGGLDVLDISSCAGCPADVNDDGELNALDFTDFLNAFFDKASAADCNSDGGFDIFDFVCFQQSFLAGCP